jgi:hypothetical protein
VWQLWAHCVSCGREWPRCSCDCAMWWRAHGSVSRRVGLRDIVVGGVHKWKEYCGLE